MSAAALWLSKGVTPLRQARKDMGLTIVEVSARLEIAKTQYHRYEAALQAPRVDRALKLAKFFDATVEELFSGVYPE